MPYRQGTCDRYLISAGWRGRTLRLSTGTPIKDTASRYEETLRRLVRYGHDEVLEALAAKEIRIPQVTRWWDEVGDRGLLGELRRWRTSREEGRLLRPEVARWLAERKALGTPKAVTLRAYAACLERAIPEAMTARELDRDAVVEALARGPNARKMHVALTLFTRWCRGQGVLTGDPMVDVPIPPPGKPRDRWLSQDRLAELLRAVRPKYRDAVMLAYGTGIEREVLVTLSPRDVNPVDRTILARGTKTHNRERAVLVAGFAWPTVERLLRERGHRRTLLPPMTGWALSKAHRQAAEAIGEHGLRLHDARHAAAVRLAKAGAPAPVIADQLGNTVQMVVTVYGKYMPSLAEKRHWEDRATVNGW